MNLDQKYELLYSHEETFSYRVAQNVIKKPEVSVWMILLPVLFIHHLHKVNQYKDGVRSFAEQLLSTKKKAMDRAYDQVLAGKSMDFGMDAYFPAHVLAGQEKDLAERQLQVIKAMEEHYLALMEVSGESLEELVLHAYERPEQYRRYIHRLEEKEQELNQYLLLKVHTSEDSRLVVRKIEEQCARLRSEEMSLFFK